MKIIIVHVTGQINTNSCDLDYLSSYSHLSLLLPSFITYTVQLLMSSTPVNVPQDESESSWFPEGYVEVIGPDGRHYVVPQHFASALHQNIDGHREKEKMDIDKASGTVSYMLYA
jgi:hypothetical protein